ncbi:hypothetical protein FDP22_01435 [Paroceanicella profunda]|uniref:APC family permease n=1 Tax=Paroceanicella profunda TaxID=2579971 RepID=A0A5B8FIA6_9RHOB|nr:hypothetical protein [Paroceanicella profunda]QDL93541.1 hypothetical protein FDP22_01435 [Paroceanicella profunda]
MDTLLILAATLVAVAALLWLHRRGGKGWRATVTPLASIIGSGFLVLGPILDAAFGAWAPIAMLGLCAVAWAFGSAIRYNIAVIDAGEDSRSRAETWLETASSWALAFAYFISVAYYLNLFGAFGVSLTPVNSDVAARVLTSVMLGLILLVGWTRGFSALERVEQVTVSLKLAIIAGLLMGLALHFGRGLRAESLVFLAPERTGWPAVTLLFGLIVTVQGFETSRYLSASYDAATRIRSMRWSQVLSTLIYVAYICLIAYVFERDDLHLEETAIIGMMAVVAPVLPLMLVVAALAAQLSAAVADTSGSGGLITELSGGRIGPRKGYAVLVGVGLALTWVSDVFEIISYASRAFALYYALQSAVALAGARRRGAGLAVQAGFGALALLGAAIVVFGVSVE